LTRVAKFYDDGQATFYAGDVTDVLRALPDESVNCVVTSPPYWGLRDYGVEGQLGLEATPEAYIERMVAVFRDVRRVLRKDGTCWLNIGDSYAAARGGTYQPAETLAGGRHGKTVNGEKVNRGRSDGYSPSRNASAFGLKHKDLVGIPWMLAFALRADGWWLRQDIIWAKPNPMPESVTDRCTKAHEYLFLLTKSATYHYDADAVREDAKYAGKVVTLGEKSLSKGQANGANIAASGNGLRDSVVVAAGRNKRSVWTIATQPYPEAHFATFPEALVEPCVLAGCPEGGIVLDPFLGSGTTALVAKRLGRRAIGIDLNPEYLALAVKRCRQLALVEVG